jgi:hypothetical protein
MPEVGETLMEILPFALLWHWLHFTIHGFSKKLFPKTYERLLTLKDRKGELLTEQRELWCCNVVSSIHGFLVSGIVFWVWRKNNYEVSALFPFKFDDATEDSVWLGRIFSGYLLNDLLMCLRYLGDWVSGGNRLMIAHHVAGLICINWLIIFNYGHAMIFTVCAVEFTSPFINLRYFFDQFEMKTSPWYIYNGIAITVLWFLIRILFFAWAGYASIFHQWDELVAKGPIDVFVVAGGFSFGYSMQVFWFYKICKGLISKLFPLKKETHQE